MYGVVTRRWSYIVGTVRNGSSCEHVYNMVHISRKTHTVVPIILYLLSYINHNNLYMDYSLKDKSLYCIKFNMTYFTVYSHAIIMILMINNAPVPTYLPTCSYRLAMRLIVLWFCALCAMYLYILFR